MQGGAWRLSEEKNAKKRADVIPFDCLSPTLVCLFNFNLFI